jgi:hypothetical protein
LKYTNRLKINNKNASTQETAHAKRLIDAVVWSDWAWDIGKCDFEHAPEGLVNWQKGANDDEQGQEQQLNSIGRCGVAKE